MSVQDTRKTRNLIGVPKATTGVRKATKTYLDVKTKGSPFKSFSTSGLRVRTQHLNSAHLQDFAYDLSADEMLHLRGNLNKAAMKAVPEKERELLTSGQRGAYLAQRYEQTPGSKYNFPEATSWRIGWLQDQFKIDSGK